MGTNERAPFLEVGAHLPGSPEEWTTWVGADDTRNYVLQDPLLDWLGLYGKDHGYRPDDEAPGYDARTDFTRFMVEQGRRFEEAVVDYVAGLVEVVRVASSPGDVRSVAKVVETVELMKQGVALIHQGVLWHVDTQTYGAPDLLVRSDLLVDRLFPGTLDPDEAAAQASALGSAGHYRVVDIKFTTLHLLASGELRNSGSSPAYKVQLYIYNRALGQLQGYEPAASYLLGRGWDQTLKGETLRGRSCMQRLAPVPQQGALAKSRTIAAAADEACKWVREVRREGADWTVLPQPTRPELYPDTSNHQDGPWSHAKKQIAQDLEDLTLLWKVGVPGRARGHEAGIFRWHDPRCTPDVVGVTGEKQPDVLKELLDVNRSSEGPPVKPSRIRAAEDEWRPEAPIEFFVDFETVNDLGDDFARIPERGGQPLIFMVGCGHVEDGEWVFECFIADSLEEESEARIIDAWFDHMESVRARVAPSVDHPRVFHWSPAESVNLETAYNSAKVRHSGRQWPRPNWFDFLNRVVRAEPVVVRGALGFGLKAIANALHSEGLIGTRWTDSSLDGLGAMVGAWWCHQEAGGEGAIMRDIDLMKDIAAYNEVDRRVMMEAIRYFRHSH